MPTLCEHYFLLFMNETFQVYQPFRKLEIKIPPHLPAHCQCLQLLEAITRFASDLPAPNQDQIRWGSLKQTTAITKQKQKQKKTLQGQQDELVTKDTDNLSSIPGTHMRKRVLQAVLWSDMHAPIQVWIHHIFNTNTYKNNFNNVIPALWKLRKEDCFKFEVYIASRRPVWSVGW